MGTEAEENKDARAIRRWRAFVWNNIRPLEREITSVLVRNSHLIHDREFPQTFSEFLDNSAKFEFVVERRKNEAGRLETLAHFTDDDYLPDHNSTGEPNYKELFQHVSLRYQRLQDDRDEVKLSLSGGAREKGV